MKLCHWIEDQKIKKKIQMEKKDVLPEGYKMRMEQFTRKLLQEKKGQNRYGRKLIWRVETVIVAAVIIVVVGSGGVYATVNYVQHRMNTLSTAEKEKMAEEAKKANADSYSRELSDAEKERLEKVRTEYESQGVLPQEQLKEISSEKEVDPEHICFLAENSTFYFPKRELTEEELLEFVDYKYKRDYSITDQAVEPEYETVSEISEEEAVNLAKEAVKIWFQEDTVKTEMEYNQTLNEREETITEDLVGLKSDNFFYTVTVGLQEGTTDVVERIPVEEETEIYASGISAAPEEYQNLYEQAKQMVEAGQLDSTVGSQSAAPQDFQYAAIEYKLTDEEELTTGVMVFRFELADGSGYLINYSCNIEAFYKVRYFASEEAFEAYDAQEEKQNASRDITKRTIVMEGAQVE